jgi:hypothetical protein
LKQSVESPPDIHHVGELMVAQKKTVGLGTGSGRRFLKPAAGGAKSTPASGNDEEAGTGIDVGNPN